MAANNSIKRRKPPVTFPAPESRAPGLMALLSNESKTWKEFEHQCAVDDFERLLKLCEHYGVSGRGPFAFHDLALAMAREFFPERKPQGRPSKWNIHTMGVLWVEIQRLVVVGRGRSVDSVRGACETLAQQDVWIDFLNQANVPPFPTSRANALRQVYLKFKHEPTQKLYWKAYRLNKKGWTAELAELLGVASAS